MRHNFCVCDRPQATLEIWPKIERFQIMLATAIK